MNHQPKSLQTTLFPLRYERINLWLPFIFVLPIAWDLLYSPLIDAETKSILMMATKVLLLNHVHIFFTLALYLFAPEVKLWIKEKASSSKHFKIRWWALTVGLFLLFYLGLPALSKQPEANLVYRLLIAATLIVGLHHNYSQMLGISLAYNQIFQKTLGSEELFKRVGTLAKIERFLFSTTITVQFIGFLAKSILEPSNIITNISNPTVFVLAGCTVLVGLLYPPSFKNKKIYVLRYALIPFLTHSYFALIALLALHGIEYLFVYLKMQSNSLRRNNLEKTSLVIGSTALVLGLTALTVMDKNVLGWWFKPEMSPSWWFISILIALSSTGSYLHYHADSLLFRMSDPVTRRSVGDLLLSNFRSTGGDQSVDRVGA